MKTKVRFNLRIVAAIVACLAGIIMFTACDKDNENGGGSGKIWLDKEGGEKNRRFNTIYDAVIHAAYVSGSGKYTIRIGGDQVLKKNVPFTTLAGKELDITLKPEGNPVKITASSDFTDGELFQIYDDCVITLDEGITLTSIDKNSYWHALSIGGNSTVIMNNGVVISGFEMAVNIGYNGTFIMNGGEIRDNPVVGMESSGNFIMNNGTISNNGVGVVSYGAFTMNGGTISKNAEGVRIGVGLFTMKGGSITGNKGSGGVNAGIESIFNMENGVISGNVYDGISAPSSGGAGVRGEGTFNMKGGEIRDNISSSNGGGVLQWFGIFTMSGGKIINNKAANEGGGVYANELFYMTGGEISGNEAEKHGGGVYFGSVYISIFTKTGPSSIINNKANYNLDICIGREVYGHGGDRRRETPAGPGVDLDSRKILGAGGWEN